MNKYGMAWIAIPISISEKKEHCLSYVMDISSVWVYSVKYSARWVENVFFPTLNYKYILHQH